jgi:hypothetical protein
MDILNRESMYSRNFWAGLATQTYVERVVKPLNIITLATSNSACEVKFESCHASTEPLFANDAHETPHDGTPPDAFTCLILRLAFGDGL